MTSATIQLTKSQYDSLIKRITDLETKVATNETYILI